MSDAFDGDQQTWQAMLKEVLEERIPFNRAMGLKVDHLEAGRAVGRLPFRDDLVGNWMRPALHGGAIAMLADTMGGAVVSATMEPGTRIATLDLRVDFLRPGEMRDLVAEATVVRQGSHAVVVAIEVHHEEPYLHVADGRGVYNVGRPPRQDKDKSTADKDLETQ
ncbi:MAG: hotdog fold thioesterase [Myxococcota bacterium]